MAEEAGVQRPQARPGRRPRKLPGRLGPCPPFLVFSSIRRSCSHHPRRRPRLAGSAVPGPPGAGRAPGAAAPRPGASGAARALSVPRRPPRWSAGITQPASRAGPGAGRAATPREEKGRRRRAEPAAAGRAGHAGGGAGRLRAAGAGRPRPGPDSTAASAPGFSQTPAFRPPQSEKGSSFGGRESESGGPGSGAGSCRQIRATPGRPRGTSPRSGHGAPGAQPACPGRPRATPEGSRLGPSPVPGPAGAGGGGALGAEPPAPGWADAARSLVCRRGNETQLKTGRGQSRI